MVRGAVAPSPAAHKHTNEDAARAEPLPHLEVVDHQINVRHERLPKATRCVHPADERHKHGARCQPKE